MEVEAPPNHNYRWKRILLIKPNYETMGWEYYNLNFPPINLTYIAAYLEDLDIEVAILDAKVKNLSYKKLKKKIKKFNPDLVGISVFVSAAINACNDYAKIVKEVNPNCIVVFGGRHPSWEPDDTLKLKEVDLLVRGEGELPFRELIIEGSPENVKGISYRSNGKNIHNPDHPMIKDFANIRFPARHLTKSNKYSMMTVRLETVETSRGCPYSCKFCTTHKFNKGLWRPRPVEKIITELKMISQNRKITDIFFVDDNLTANTKRIEHLCERIIECKKTNEINDFKFFAQIRVDSVVKSPRMVEKMAAAGFWIVFIGIEGVSEKKLKDVRKGFTFNKVIEGIKILHKNDMIVIGNLIIGLDLNETEDELKKEIQFMKTIDIDIISYVLLTPFPGSDTLKEFEEQGLLITKDWSKYTVFDPVIRTHALTPKQMHKILYYSFRELKYIHKLGSFGQRVYRARGLSFFLSLPRLLSILKSYIRIKAIRKEF
ncbi:MAG: cobalamin B12-binding domain-containing protein [Candidatus Helarchaeota archaeon]|nr:cobalamin B12-binding domain-containing protein [Candidatus Helarchaeota archaeon]